MSPPYADGQIDLAGEDSFPASDPPGWTTLGPGAPRRRDHDADPEIGEITLASSRSLTPPWQRPVAEAIRRPVPSPGAPRPGHNAQADRADAPQAELYRPARSPLQHGRRRRGWVLELARTRRPWSDPLMGWTSGADPDAHTVLAFPTAESPVRFAGRRGWRLEMRES